MAKAATIKTPDGNEETQVRALVDAVKLAPDLRSLHRALMALVVGGDIGGHAFKRIALNNLRRYGGKRPNLEGVLSWDSEHALVIGEEGLEGARIVERGNEPKREAPRERKRSDEAKPREAEPDAVANDGAEQDTTDAAPELAPPSAEELATLLREHLTAARFTVGECRVTIRASGVRFKLAATYRSSKVGGEWPWPAAAMHGDGLREFLEGLADGLRGEG